MLIKNEKAVIAIIAIKILLVHAAAIIANVTSDDESGAYHRLNFLEKTGQRKTKYIAYPR